MNGFTYNGIHCNQFGVGYVPDAKDRWFEDPEFEVYSKDVDWRDGGYYFGNKVNIREFNLKCYFEEIDIATREKIRRWLGRNTSGRLVFDDKPFVWWDVRPGAIVSGELYNDHDLYSGTFEIPFVAHKPFGYLTRKSNGAGDDDGAEDYCGLIATSLMPAAPTTSARNFMVYNPGTEAVGMTIRVSGTTTRPICFLNKVNGTNCILTALPTGGLVLDINGETGKIIVYQSSSPNAYDNGYAYHDRGMVVLEPNETQTDVAYTKSTTSGTTQTVIIDGIGNVGDRILFSNTSLEGEVISASADGTTLICTMTGSGTLPNSGKCTVSSMNRIQILEQNSSGNWVTPTGLTISSIAIDYQPKIL